MTPTPTAPPTAPYDEAGSGVAGPLEQWNVGGAGGQGVQTCYNAVMASAGCAKDYFTYSHGSSGNCGCKGSTEPLSVRSDGKSTYYSIKAMQTTMPSNSNASRLRTDEDTPQEAYVKFSDNSYCQDGSWIGPDSERTLAGCEAVCYPRMYMTYKTDNGNCRCGDTCNVKGMDSTYSGTVYQNQAEETIIIGNFTMAAGGCRTASGDMGTFTQTVGQTLNGCSIACETSGSCRAFEFDSATGKCEIHTETITEGSGAAGSRMCYVKANEPVVIHAPAGTHERAGQTGGLAGVIILAIGISAALVLVSILACAWRYFRIRRAHTNATPIFQNKNSQESYTMGGQQSQSSVSSQITEDENKIAPWDFFLSHTQRNPMAVSLAVEIYYSMLARGKKVWLDVKMRDKSSAGMEHGVQNSKIVLAILTGSNDVNTAYVAGYFSRPFCCQELRWATEKGIFIQPIINVSDKPLISEILSEAPEDLRFLSNIDFIDINRSDSEYFDLGIQKIMRVLAMVTRGEAVMNDSVASNTTSFSTTTTTVVASSIGRPGDRLEPQYEVMIMSL